MGPVLPGGRLSIKGRPYALSELVGDEREVSRYEGGQFAIVYLSPRDYHRVHAPVAGVTPLVRSMPGDLYPVNSIGERHVPSLFARNRRVAIAIDTPDQGRVTVVMVGAMIVGRITVTAVPGRDVPLGLHTLEKPLAVERGDEIGVFHLGSTAVVFLEKGAASPLAERRGAFVRMGEPLERDAGR
jgi:phosphatidylserine decarboxylase